MRIIVMPCVLWPFFISVYAMELVDDLSGLGEYSVILAQQTQSLNTLINESVQSNGSISVNAHILGQQLQELQSTYENAICGKLEWMRSVIETSYRARMTAEQESDQLKEEYAHLYQSHAELKSDADTLERERDLFKEACDAARHGRDSSGTLLEQRTSEMRKIQQEYATLAHQYVHLEQIYKTTLTERNAMYVELHLMKKKNEQVEQQLKTVERCNRQLTQELKEARFFDQQKLDLLVQERRRRMRIKHMHRTFSASTDEIGKQLETSHQLMNQSQSLVDLGKALQTFAKEELNVASQELHHLETQSVVE